MSRTFDLNLSDVTALPSPAELISTLPVSSNARQMIDHARHSLSRIIDGIDHRLLLIIGPCSIHNTTAAIEYAMKLRRLAERVSDRFLVMMRVHGEKPRTTVGWKGILYDPDLDDSHDMVRGLNTTRKLLLELADIGIPVSTELLDPMSAYYFSDLISWAQIGARTSASQVHRQMAAGLPMPVGFKNDTEGNLDTAINAAITASHPHTHFGLTMTGKIASVHSPGNPYSHIVLRGSEQGANYHPHAVLAAVKRLKQEQAIPRVMIDCSHDNCRKHHTRQVEVFERVIDQVRDCELERSPIFGMMLESYLEEGRQSHPNNPAHIKSTVSLTDPCLNWDTTEELVLSAYEKLSPIASSLPV